MSDREPPFRPVNRVRLVRGLIDLLEVGHLYSIERVQKVKGPAHEDFLGVTIKDHGEA